MGWNLQDYEPVEDRIRAFYEDNRKGRILTEIAHHNEDFSFVIFKATVFRSDGTEPAATGHAYEKATQKGVNSTSHLENCETSAIGRALADLGYGAKGKRPSREEMQKVQDSAGLSTPSQADAPAKTPPKHSGEGVTQAATQTPVETQAVAKDVTSSSDQSQKSQEVAPHNKGGVVADTAAGEMSSVPPGSSDWLQLIETYTAATVLQAAQIAAKEAKEKPPFTKKALNDLSPSILERVSNELAQRARVA